MRAIVFDLDGTLVEFDRPYSDILEDAIRTVEGQCRPEWLEQYEEAFFDFFGTFEPDPVRRAFDSLAGCSDPAALAAALLEQEIAACETPPGADEDLERLSQTHQIGVLTDGVRSWQRRKLAASGLDEHVDVLVASYEVGAHKPDPAPFERVEDRLEADEFAMVGDDDVDVEGAAAVGWAAHRSAGGGFGELPDVLDWA